MKRKLVSSIFRPLASLADAKLGRCVFCMRKSFTAALIAWAAILGMVQFPVLRDNSRLVSVSLAVALTSTLLWLAHLVAAATRSTRSTRTALSKEALSGEQLSRRNSLLLLAKSFAVAAFWSAVPRAVLGSNMVNCSAALCFGDQSYQNECQTAIKYREAAERTCKGVMGFNPSLMQQCIHNAEETFRQNSSCACAPHCSSAVCTEFAVSGNACLRAEWR